MVNKDLMYFSQNLKTTSLGVRFGKTLLEKPDSLNPKIITNVMKELGYPIPTDVQVAADAAQALVTGAAVVNRTVAGTYTDYKELIKPGVGSLSTLTRIGNQAGLIDDRTAGLVNLGLDAALIFASGGLDLNAWMRVAMSIAGESARAEAEAMQKAQIRAVEALKGKYEQEAADFAENLLQLQNGELGIFSFLAESVDEIPLMFPNLVMKNPAFEGIRQLMPGLKFLPVGPWTFKGKGSEHTFWGEEKSKEFDITVEGLSRTIIPKYGLLGAVDYLLYYLAYQPAEIIMNYRRDWMMRGKADYFNVALFALFEPSFVLKPQMDLLNVFEHFQLTPFEIGESDTFRNAIDSTSQAVTTSFGFGLAANRLPKAILNVADQTGNIDLIRNDVQAADLVRKRFDFVYTQQEQSNKFQTSNIFDPRNVANFIAILDMLDLVYTDPQYEKIKATSKLLPYFDLFPRSDTLRAQFSLMMNRSVTRRVNKAARLNVQVLTGIPANKLQPIVREGQATIFK